MNRRDLNRILMIGTALAGGWPVWLRRAFGAEAAPGRDRLSPSGQQLSQRWRQIVSAAHRRAVQAGKPLLVFVVPSAGDDAGGGYEARWERGQAFGELLNHGDDEALATLALAEIVCAPMAALHGVASGLPIGEPLMVLVETDGSPAPVRVLDAPLPGNPGLDGRAEPLSRVELDSTWSPPDWETIFKRQRIVEEAAIQRRIGALTRLLDQGLRATPQMLLDRAGQAQACLSPSPSAEILSATAGPAYIHRMAAILLASAAGLSERDRQPVIERVADAGRAVLCRRRVPGSRWASTSGRATV